MDTLDVKEALQVKEKYKIGWYDEYGRRQYRLVDKEDVLPLVADKLDTSDHISIKKTELFKLEEEK